MDTLAVNLRRFARTLTGSSTAADALFDASLPSAGVDLGSTATPSSPDRIAAYRAVVDVWTGGASAEGSAPRIAYLLEKSEVLSTAEIAAAMRVSVAQVKTFLHAAEEEIRGKKGANILIVEDEPLIALDLQYVVEQLGHRVETVARTQVEAVRVALKSRPDLILADVQLADGSSGLAAANEILQQIEAPIIFVTAYPERLLTGHAAEPAFLITKPFNPDAVKSAIGQALFLGPPRAQPRQA
jgi:CheY-like chemotaxis protein